MKIKFIPILLLGVAFLIACGPPPPTTTEADNASEDAMVEESAEESAAVEEEAVVEEAAEPVAQDLGGLTELEFEVIEEGNGEQPEEGDYVKVHFIGSLADGTEFANSYTQGGDPLVYPFGQAGFFEGWTMALSRMSFGEKANVGIPAALAFGEQGTGVIPPNADLFFELELVGKAEVGFESVEEGDGEQAMPGDVVQVEYTGTLEDGTVFDSSSNTGQPFEFVLGQGMVIPGWDIGIGMMREGGTAILTIPSELAYGAAGAGDVIPPNATLIFEVELVSIQRINQ